jgi:hypothetical protein
MAESNYYNARTGGGPSRNDLLKSMRKNEYVVLKDEFDRLYFIPYSKHLLDHWDASTTIACHPMLSRKYQDPKVDAQDERVYTFPENGDRIALTLYWYNGKRYGSKDPVESLGYVYDPYRYGKRVTGFATLWLPEGLPSI